MVRWASVAAGAVMAVGALTACGGGDDYCAIMEDNIDINPTSDEAADVIRNARDAAPEEIKDEWDQFVDVAESGEQPENATEFQQAMTNIAEYTDRECNVDMGG